MLSDQASKMGRKVVKERNVEYQGVITIFKKRVKNDTYLCIYVQICQFFTINNRRFDQPQMQYSCESTEKT